MKKTKTPIPMQPAIDSSPAEKAVISCRRAMDKAFTYYIGIGITRNTGEAFWFAKGETATAQQLAGIATADLQSAAALLVTLPSSDALSKIMQILTTSGALAKFAVESIGTQTAMDAAKKTDETPPDDIPEKEPDEPGEIEVPEEEAADTPEA